MTSHPVVVAFPAGATSQSAIVQNLAQGFALVIDAAADIQVMNLTGLAPRGVQVGALAGLFFRYDAADTTTAHDGVACIVSADGKRYKSAVVPAAFVNVKAHELATPPASPAAGDRYAIPAAPTGAWAAHANELTVYSGGAWLFTAPAEGFTTWSEAGGTLIHMGAAGDWVEGIGAASIPAGAVDATALQSPWGFVVQAETATPPGGTPAASLKWIVGAAATGVWATHDGEIAEADGAGGWGYFAPYDGARVYDLAADIEKKYDAGSGAWLSGGGVWVDYLRYRTADTSSTSAGGTAGYVWSAATAPTSSAWRRADDVGVPIAAPTGVKLRFSYRFTVETWATPDAYFGAGSKNLIAALYRDSEVNCIDWQMTGVSGTDAAAGEIRGGIVVFEVSAIDSLSHTYKVGLLNATDSVAAASYRPATISRRAFTCEVNRG